LGAKAIAARSTFEGRCVKTIVRRSPIRAASCTAAWNESACRMPTAKKTTPSICGESAVPARERVRDERLHDKSSSEAVERE
jgi:hypothetical protein